MIYLRRECEEVRPGINILWGKLAKNVILSFGRHSLHILWNRHTRRLTFAMPYTVLRPWRKIRELELAARRYRAEIHALDRALSDANERYDKIREANLQLRDALSLYRKP